jgi:hypothetical protein
LALRAELDAPEMVQVTGLSERLKKPHFRLSLEGTPILSGLAITAGVLLLIIGIFFLALHSSRGR